MADSLFFELPSTETEPTKFISQFKSVFKHHTNFSIEPVSVSLGTATPRWNTEVSIPLPIAGDLITHMALQVNLPAIDLNLIRAASNTLFAWDKDLLWKLIEYVRLQCGDVVISELTGEAMRVQWHTRA